MKLLPILLIATTALAMEIQPASVTLPGSAWQVASFGGQNPLAAHPISLEFDAEGNIAGNGSCNRFGGSCTIEGNTIKIGPLRSTRRACEPDIMQQERKFLALLGSVTTWEVNAEGELLLRGEGGEIRAARAPRTPEN